MTNPGIILYEAGDKTWIDNPESTAKMLHIKNHNRHIALMVEDKTNKVLWLREGTPDDFLELKKRAISVKSFTASSEVVIVPETLYDETKMQEMFSFVTGKTTNNVNSFNLPLSNAILISESEGEETDVSACWINMLLEEYKNKSGNHCHINIEKTILQGAVFKDGEFVLFNQFKVNSPEDILYFTLLIMEQTNLEIKTSTLFFSGIYDKDSPEILLLEKYIPLIIPEPLPKGVEVSLPILTLPHTRFIVAYSTLLCA